MPVVLSFVCLSQQSTLLLQCTPIVLSLYIFLHTYPAYIYNLHTSIPRTESHFQYKKLYSPVSVSV